MRRRPSRGRRTARSRSAQRDRRLLALRGLLKEPSIVMSGSVFRAQALRAARGYSDLSYGEDANLALLVSCYHRRRIASALDGSYGRRVLGDDG